MRGVSGLGAAVDGVGPPSNAAALVPACRRSRRLGLALVPMVAKIGPGELSLQAQRVASRPVHSARYDEPGSCPVQRVSYSVERRASVRALAKINLDLRVLDRRPDGYHELRTIFQTISLADRLDVAFTPARA